MLHALGDIPSGRIVWDPPPGTATEADLLGRGKQDGLIELVDGVLVRKPTTARKSFAVVPLIIHLMSYVRPRRLGVIAGPGCPVRLNTRTVRLPDVSFTAWQNLPEPDAHLQRVADFAPDLVAEFCVEGITRREMARKRREYFRRGVSLVWIIDPAARTAAVYTDPRTHTLLTEADTLTGGAVLPGWSLPLAEFFNDPQLQPPPAA